LENAKSFAKTVKEFYDKKSSVSEDWNLIEELVCSESIKTDNSIEELRSCLSLKQYSEERIVQLLRNAV